MITDIADLITKASDITVLTGAGVSAESGIPTFRDAMTGLWAKFDPHELAILEAFERNPARVSQWYDERTCAVRYLPVSSEPRRIRPSRIMEFED